MKSTSPDQQASQPADHQTREPVSELSTDSGLPAEAAALLELALGLDHDLNNPLAGALGFSELLVQDLDQLSESQTVAVMQINKCALRLRELIDQLSHTKAELARKLDMEELKSKLERLSTTQSK